MIMQISTIGIGLGGSNVAQAIRKEVGGDIFLINLSQQDLNTSSEVPANNQLHLGDASVNGAGKNRKNGQELFREENNKLADKLRTWLKPRTSNKELELVLVCFSTAGGTGSGIGPSLVTFLDSEEFKKSLGYDVVIDDQDGKVFYTMGVAILPDDQEGTKSLLNTIEALREIDIFSRKEVARFCLINNSFSSGQNLVKRYSEINNSVAKLLKRYIDGFGHSQYGCLDHADRKGALRHPGLHSFSSVGSNGNANSPFMTPNGCRVKSVLAEIEEGQEESLTQLFNIEGIVADDKILGFYKGDERSELTPVVHFSGFNNLSRVTEQVRTQLNALKAKLNAIEKKDAGGTGLSGLKKERDWAGNEYVAKRVADIGSITSMLDENND